jgi:hypothetical protein
MSTAYPPRLIKYLFSSKKERNAAKTTAMKPGHFGKFPDKFGLYYSGHGQDFLSLYFQISEIEPRKDLYAVTFHKGPGLTQATIYSSSEHGSTPMVVAINERRYGNAATFTIAGEVDGQARTERMGYKGFASNTYTISMHGETFELRENTGARPKVTQIVRLAANPSSEISGSQTEGTNVSSEDRGECDISSTSSARRLLPTLSTASSDEVVATWTEGSIPNREARLAIFRFADNRPVDRFGEDWALCTIAAVLTICQRGAAIEGKFRIKLDSTQYMLI